jgi:glycogen debranching enzyme
VNSAGKVISERVMLKRDRFFAVSGRDGSIDSREFLGDGLWMGDTRILSTFLVLIDGLQPEPLASHADNASATFELQAGALRVSRRRFIESGLHERITIVNKGIATVDLLLEIDVAADFAAMLGIRGAVRELPKPTPVEPVKTVEGVRFREVRVSTFPHGFKHPLHLGRNDEFSMTVDVGDHAVDFDAGLQAAREIYKTWSENCMHVETDNPALNELLEQSTADVRMLCDAYDTGIYPTAGLPWYAVPFGRDALITAILLLHVNPELARGALRYLARHQGARVDERTDEQPGKILHEVRHGEVVDRDLWPHIL